VLAQGVQLFGEMQGSGYRNAPALVRRQDGQTITLTPLLYRTLEALAHGNSWEAVAEDVSCVVDRDVTVEDVQYLVDEKLRPLGLLVAADGVQPKTRKKNPLLALKLKVVITDENVTRRLTSPFARLFAPVLMVPLLAAFAAISWWVFVEKGLASALHQAFFQPGMILALWVMIVASAAFHEFGHAAACRYGGATPGAMGAGLYLVWPAFYTEVTDSYRLSRAGRLRVDVGGLYFNAVFTVASWALWWFVRWDALLLVVVAQHLQMVRQLAPFIRADGYHIVADLTGVPDLFAHIKPTLMSVLPRRFRPAVQPPLKRWARVIVVLWVVSVVPVLVGVMTASVLMLPILVATAWSSMGFHWHSAGAYWAEGDLAGAVVRLLSVLLVALPVLSVVYLLGRMARRTVRRVWKATEGSPRKRAGAILVGAALAAFLAWAWWPAGQYHAVDPESRGSVADLASVAPLPDADRRRVIPFLDQADTVPVASVYALGTPTSGVLPAPSALSALSAPVVPQQIGGIPWAIHSVVGPVDAVPDHTAPSSPDPTVVRDAWPFPWPEPPAPLVGDNRAMAVNTVDNAVVMDLAVSWAIVTATRAEENNEAWALASCTNCATRAVAYQVLMTLPGTEVIAPVNAAVAANYECRSCLTEAIAVQLVVSVTGIPSVEAQALIEQAMARVQALDVQLKTLSAGQIYTILQTSQLEIMRILDEDGKIPATAPPNPGPTPEAPPAEAPQAPTAPATSSPGPEPSEAPSPEPSTSEPSGPSEPSEPSEPSTSEAPTPEQGGTDPAPADEQAPAPSEPAPQTNEPEPAPEPSGEPSGEPSAEPSSDAGAAPVETAEPTPSSP
jgi:putative peptide zinc metalloprotease protein